MGKAVMPDSSVMVRAGFNDAANVVRNNYTNALNSYLDQNYRARIGELDDQVAEIRRLRINKSETCKRLESAQEECRQLIADIHREPLLLTEPK